MDPNFNHPLAMIEAQVSGSEEENWKIKQTIQAMDHGIQKKLLMSNLIIFGSELALIFVIIYLYIQVNGSYALAFLSLLILVFLLMARAAHRIWENMAYQPTNSREAYHTYLTYHTAKLISQRKLVLIYLLTYALIQTMAISFYLLFTNSPKGIILLLRVTAPASAISYLLGLYFLWTFSRQLRLLNAYERKQKNHPPKSANFFNSN